MNLDLPTLFVSWRSPQSRSIYPVGRFSFDSESSRYQFVYIQSALGAIDVGFQPFLEFPDLHRVYLSRQPFPMLANRLMPAGRPELPNLLTSLGLPAAAHPLMILARSGGTRKTDDIELFPMPVPETTSGCYSTHCLIRAIRYMPPSAESRILGLQPNEQLLVMWDVQNPVDPQAAALRTADNHLVGYMPAYLTRDVWKLNRECGTLDVFVERVNPPPAEVHHRLLCRVVACWPDRFRPFDDEVFQPMEATVESPA